MPAGAWMRRRGIGVTESPTLGVPRARMRGSSGGYE